MPEITIESARRQDLQHIATIFSRAFPESMLFFTGRETIPLTPLTDAFGLILRAEPGGFWVARYGKEGRVAGYIIATRNVRRIWQKALFRGWWLGPACRCLAGRYGLGCGVVLKAMYNKIFFLRSEKTHGKEGQARILSLAVDPSLQSRGIGRKLLSEGLAYLHCGGVASVKLDVRPHNMSALRLYMGQGFLACGSFQDLQGEWHILEKKL